MHLRLLTCFALLLLSARAFAAPALTTEDRDRAQAYLEKTRDTLMAATANLSAAQWNFKPAPDRWSVGEVAEHLAATEAFLLNLVREQVLNAPAPTEPVDVAEIDAMILATIPDRSRKFPAPEPLVPTNRFGNASDTRKQFETNRQATLALLKERKDLREHAIDSPLGKKLDGLQWLLFIGAHSERHTKQIEEVKADPNFPKR